MADELPFFSPRFIGKRFKGHLPLSILEDLSAYEDLLIEVAKYLYLQEHDKKRVPNGFTDGISLELASLQTGSTFSQIKLVSSEGTDNPFHPYLEKARDTISNVIALASSHQSIKGILPNHLLRRFNKIGKNLEEEESIEFSPNTKMKSVLNKQTRRNIIFATGEQFIKENVLLRARVTAYDKETNECTIRFSDNSLKMEVPTSFRRLIMDAYGKFEDHDNRILIKGEAKKDKTDKIHSIDAIESIEELDALDIASRIDDLMVLEDGWLDGDGLAMDKQGLIWFSKTFQAHYASILPLPHIFPRVDGGIQLEWNTTAYSAVLEVNLIKKRGVYFQMNKKDRAILELDLNLESSDGWNSLNQHLQILIV